MIFAEAKDRLGHHVESGGTRPPSFLRYDKAVVLSVNRATD